MCLWKDQVLYHFTFTKKFSVFSYNVRGISIPGKCNKVLQRFVYPYHDKSPSVLCFQELKLNYDSQNKFIKKLPSYKTFVTSNPGTAGAAIEGVSLSIHKSLNPVILDKKIEHGWLVLVKCRILEKVFVIGSVYMPSQASTSLYRERLQALDSHLRSLKSNNIILKGDFNVDIDNPDFYIAQEKYKLLVPFLERWELQDVWRIQNPLSTRCTHHSTRARALKAFLDGDMKTVQVQAFHLYRVQRK